MRLRHRRRNLVRFFAALLAAAGVLLYGLHVYQVQQAKRDIVSYAEYFLGMPYRYGGAAPDGFDCSGYIMFLFREFGKELPRTADLQATVGKPVSAADLKPGNVLFFATTEEPVISHCGLYIGGNRFIHASSGAKKVIISSFDSPYWRKAFRGAREIR